MIEVEQAVQPFGFANHPVLMVCSLIREEDDIVEPLMFDNKGSGNAFTCVPSPAPAQTLFVSVVQNQNK
jgi:hypothetical protein